jgi:heme oxygenase
MFMMNPHAGAAVRDTGFVEEMRRVAMRLHSPQQSKQGKKEATKKEEMSPMEWKPTVEGYLNFLVESKVVYNTFESLMKNAPADSAFQDFTNTGLERSEGLEKDIAWLSQKYGLEVPVAKGAGVEYSKFLTDLAKKDEAAFLCHFYNFQFAHSAGGRMIGRKVSEMLLDGKELEFYKWEDLDGSRARTKEKINLLAEGLSQEEKDRCLEETAAAFDMSGKLLRNIAQ